MAKTYGVNIDINTNSKETQKEFDRLRKSIAEATDEVNDLSKQFGENSKEADAARKSLSELTLAYDGMTKEATDLGATFEDVYGEMKPLTGQMGEMEDRLYQMALAGDTSSQAYKDLLEEVGNYRRVQIETDLAVDGAAETLTGKLGKGLEGVTSGFAATQGAMALFGSENEALEKTLLKVQSALAIQQGVKGLRTSYRELGGATGIATTIQSGFNKVLKANPIGLIVTAIAAVIAALGSLTDVLDPVIQAFKDFGDLIGLTNFAEEEQAEAREIRHQNEMARIAAEKEARETAFNERQDQFNREIALAKALGKETFEIEKERIKDKIAFNARERNENQKTFDDAVAQLKILEKQYKNASETEKQFIRLGLELNRERVKEYKKYVKAVKDGENELKILTINNAKETKQKEKSNQKDRLSNYKTYLQNRINAARKIEDQENKLLEEGIEKELEINRDKFRREREDIKRNENLLKDERLKRLDLNRKLEAKAEQKIRDKFAKQKQAEDERREKEAFDALKAIKVISGQETLNLLNEQLQAENAAVIAADKERQRIEKEAAERRKRNIEFSIESTKQGLDVILSLTEIFGKKNEKAARTAFKIQKAAQIAGATIDTYRNATSAYGSQLVVGDPTSPVRGAIAAGIAVAAGLANIATIASQKFEGGGAAGGTGEPSTEGLEGGAITPEFNVVGDSGINQLAQLQQQPVQAFVVSGEVTTAQSLDRNRVQNATL
jgi:hypothetical protein